ncbi:MAG: ferrous iron transporter B [Ruminococcaceae bacterium]|nr:ferrous iron transporter B [Oscillospiraceae bacterium]
MFFIGAAAGFTSSLLSTLLLTTIILLGIITTLIVTRLLSATILKGVPSSFTLELPPYRPPQIGKIIIRSVFDRTLFVLGRAAAVAAPAGILIWLLANISIGDSSLLNITADFLDPFGKQIGLDGTILLAFILGFPANEIVVPIIIMIYLSQGTLSDITNLSLCKEIFLQNGWTPITAVCTMIFSLMHWPCSTTLMTIKKETGSLKWTAAAAIIPTACGIGLCFIINTVSKLFI